MEKSVKNKILILCIYVGVAVAIYLTIRFVLPVVAPFVFALLVAFMVEKPVALLTEKMHLKRAFGSAIIIVIVFAGICALLFLGGKMLAKKIGGMSKDFSKETKQIERTVSDCCCSFDKCFSLKKGESFRYVSAQFDRLVSSMSKIAVEGVVNLSKRLAIFMTALAFMMMGSYFISKDMSEIKSTIKKSDFYEELSYLGGRLKLLIGTYLKTQLIIMTITCVICIVGLKVVGNRHWVALGILIGIMDALPVLGTGTVFVPWIVILVILGQYATAVKMLILYIVCYSTRSFLEPKLMAGKMEMSPVVLLMSMYVGLVCFGISGVITGPISAVLLVEIAGLIIKKLVKNENY